MKFKLIVIIISLGFILYFCSNFDKIICGELEGERKVRFDRANAFAQGYKVEIIPCENFYTNLLVDPEIIDTITIDSIHQILIGHVEPKSWYTLIVYNSKREFLFSHNYTNRIGGMPNNM